ncbi:hypothetical protein [Fontimonas thermophila]|uniref:hypothetical protein n=1 Tax=Fontimonas thermophila TaxID=1076937 RepID=UPI000B89343B|nr:hypothetical protein [Fontimonas thermophila]
MLPTACFAHSFGSSFNLPVPFWLYAWGSVAALVASFVVSGYFSRSTLPKHYGISRAETERHSGLPIPILPLRILSVGLFALCIATGLLGTTNPYANFNMTFFWIAFVLGMTYVTALLGNLYAIVNPWQALCAAVGQRCPRYRQGLFRYPQSWGHWPAFALYGGFIWIELYGETQPYSLALILLGYSALNIVGAGVFGLRDWFRHCEFFGLFFRLIALLAPFEIALADGGYRIRRRTPFAAIVESRADDFGVLAFLLFMLSSTAFDGLSETVAWHRWFWVDLYHALLQKYVGRNPLAAFPAMRELFSVWGAFWLFASSFVYLAIYGGFIWLQRLIVAPPAGTKELALRFAPTLLPIALAYHVTHYYTLIQTQGVKLISLVSDPFGRGWNLFGTAHWLQHTIIPDAITVWHVQVILIVVGHGISVYLAHRVALCVFGNVRAAMISQLPMLALMLLFTVGGLWILAQPLAGPG